MWHLTCSEEKKNEGGLVFVCDNELDIKPWSLTSVYSQIKFCSVFLGVRKFYHQIKYFSFIHITILLTSLHLRTHHSEMCSCFQSVSKTAGTCISKEMGGPVWVTPWRVRCSSLVRVWPVRGDVPVFANSAFVIPTWLTSIWAKFGLVLAGDLSGVSL